MESESVKTFSLRQIELTGVYTGVNMYVPSLNGTSKIVGRISEPGTHFNESTVRWKRLPWKQPSVTTSIVIVTRTTSEDSHACPQKDNSWNPATGQANKRMAGDKFNLSLRIP